MKIHFRGVGPASDVDIYTTQDLVPRENDYIGFPDGREFCVRTVVWFPQGSQEDAIPEPFVYVVIGDRRPS